MAHEFARAMEADHPDLVVSLQRKVLREGKVLIDWSQNSAAKTTVCPYSLRGRLHPTVAAPRTWDELAEPDLRQLGHEEVLERAAQGIDPIAAQGWRGPIDGGDDDDRLATYRSMRDAGRTPEPVPAGPPTPSSGNSFVIQEHHARRLHWDFRLERDGVLVSWAVPKGPHSRPEGTGSPSTPRTTRSSTAPSRARSEGGVRRRHRDDLGLRHLRDREVAGRRGDRRPHGTPRRRARGRAAPVRPHPHRKDEEDTWLLHLMKDQSAPTEPRPPESASEPEPTAARALNAKPPCPPAGVPAITDLPLPMLATPGTADGVTGPAGRTR